MRLSGRLNADLIEGFLLGKKEESEFIDRLVRTVARKMLSGWSEDEFQDVQQEIQLKLIENFRGQKFKGECKLETYIWRIAANTCIDEIRKKKRTPKCESIDDIQLEPVDTGKNPMEFLESKEERSIFEKIFAQWPEMCRQLWKLLSDGYSNREISKKLAISEETVRTRLFRCKQMAIGLRIKITGEGNI